MLLRATRITPAHASASTRPLLHALLRRHDAVGPSNCHLAVHAGAAPRASRCRLRHEITCAEQVTKPARPSRSYAVPSYVTDGRGLAASAGVFCVLLVDQSLPAHLLSAGADEAVHSWVNGHLSAADRLWWDRVGSNISNDITLLLCPVALVAGVLADPKRAVRAAVVAQAAYSGCAGIVAHDDPWLVKLFKEGVHRARPSVSHSTYSFPSGHSTSAAFLAGLLLWVLLPLVFTPPSAKEQEEQRVEEQPAPKPLLDGRAQAALWATAAASTAGGRMLADVHWCSDTVAGVALGMGVACAAATATQWMDSVWGDGREEAEHELVQGSMQEDHQEEAKKTVASGASSRR